MRWFLYFLAVLMCQPDERDDERNPEEEDDPHAKEMFL